MQRHMSDAQSHGPAWHGLAWHFLTADTISNDNNNAIQHYNSLPINESFGVLDLEQTSSHSYYVF